MASFQGIRYVPIVLRAILQSAVRFHGAGRLAGTVIAAGWLLCGCGQYVYHWTPEEG